MSDLLSFWLSRELSINCAIYLEYGLIITATRSNGRIQYFPTTETFFSFNFFEKTNGLIYSAGAQHRAVNWPVCQVKWSKFC